MYELVSEEELKIGQLALIEKEFDYQRSMNSRLGDSYHHEMLT